METTKIDNINILLYSLFFSFMFNYFNDYNLIIVIGTIIFYFYKQIKNKKYNNDVQTKYTKIIKMIKTDNLSDTSEDTSENTSEDTSAENSEKINDDINDNNNDNNDKDNNDKDEDNEEDDNEDNDNDDNDDNDVNDDDDDDDDDDNDDDDDDDDNDDDKTENDENCDDSINQIDIIKLLGNYENIGDSGIMELKNKMKELDKLVELYKSNPSIMEEFSIVKE